MRTVFVKNKGKKYIVGSLLKVIATACILLCFYYGSLKAGEANKKEYAVRLEDSVRKAAVQCYALEGQYPADINYLREHYGLHYDEDKYVVHYISEGANLMPDITVIAQ